MFTNILLYFLNTVLIDLPIIRIISDQTCQTALALQHCNSLLQTLNLFQYERCNIGSLLLIEYLQLSIFPNRLSHQLLLIILKQHLNFPNYL